jgi:hypothetical protein
LRTFIFLVAGLALWAGFIVMAKSVFAASSTAVQTATIVFAATWFVVAAANLWVGISQAGYSFREELPIFLLIFLVPAAVAGLAKWQFL